MSYLKCCVMSDNTRRKNPIQSLFWKKSGIFWIMENDEMYHDLKPQGISNEEVYSKIAENLDIGRILRKASEDWDGGYVMAGPNRTWRCFCSA